MTVPSPPTVLVESRRSVLIGVLAALGAGIAYGAGQFLARKITGEVEPLVGAALAVTSGTIILVVITAKQVYRERGGPRRAYAAAALSGLSAATAVMFMFLALSKAPVVKVAPFFGLQPLFAIILSQLFIRRLEHLTWRLTIGAALVIGGVILVLVSG